MHLELFLHKQFRDELFYLIDFYESYCNDPSEAIEAFSHYWPVRDLFRRKQEAPKLKLIIQIIKETINNKNNDRNHFNDYNFWEILTGLKLIAVFWINCNQQIFRQIVKHIRISPDLAKEIDLLSLNSNPYRLRSFRDNKTFQDHLYYLDIIFQNVVSSLIEKEKVAIRASCLLFICNPYRFVLLCDVYLTQKSFSTSLDLKGFRSFEKNLFNLKKINIIIGPNSSGKSSLLKWFLFINQTLLSNEKFFFTYKNDVIDLGAFTDILAKTSNQTSVSAKTTFSSTLFTQRNNEKNYCLPFNINREIEQIDRVIGTRHPSWSIEDYIYDVTGISLEIQFNSLKSITQVKYVIQRRGKPTLIKLDYHQEQRHQQQACTIRYENGEEKRDFKNISIFKRKQFLIYPNLETFKRDLNKNPKFSLECFLDLALISFINEVYRSFYFNIDYIGAAKLPPQRYYLTQGIESDNVGYQGQRFSNVFRLAKVNTEKKEEFFKNINTWIQNFGLGDTLSYEELDRQEFISAFEINRGGLPFNLVDSGFGTSQLLPFITNVIINSVLGNNRLVIAEEPESHLHPKAQSLLADFLVAHAHTQRFIIETHSEHLLRKLQLLVAQKKFDSNDIAIYYMHQPEPNRTTVLPIHILENGQLDKSIPSGFYDESANLIQSLFDIF